MVNKTKEVNKFIDSLNEFELKNLMRELLYTVDVNFDMQNWIYDIYVNNDKKDCHRKRLTYKGKFSQEELIKISIECHNKIGGNV